MDIIGEALRDYYQKNSVKPLLLHNSYGTPEEMPVEVFFREEEDLPDVELCALDICEGSVLDVGAGVGAHSLILQDRGFKVVALEISEESIEIMSKRGVKGIYKGDIFRFKKERFDTLLLLMNGIGIVGTLNRLEVFLEHVKDILNPDGQILLDSSDIMYLYEDTPKPIGKYYGEISYRYEYKSRKGSWFDWLYIDPITLEEIADKAGYHCQIIFEGEEDNFLARLTLKSF